MTAKRKTTPAAPDIINRYESLAALHVPGMKKVFLTSDPGVALRALDDFDGVQLGAEFCAKHLPQPAAAARVIEECRRRNKLFSLVTPLMDDPGVTRVKRLVGGLEKYAPFDVVANDFGAFGIIAEAGMAPVAGRIIVRQKSDPRLAQASRGALWKFMRQSACDNSGFRALLRDLGVKSIEMDNPAAGVSAPGDFSVSLHYPFVFLTMKGACEKGACARCGEVFVLRSPQIETDIIMKGGTQFYVNEKLEKKIAADRLVCAASPPA